MNKNKRIYSKEVLDRAVADFRMTLPEVQPMTAPTGKIFTIRPVYTMTLTSAEKYDYAMKVVG